MRSQKNVVNYCATEEKKERRRNLLCYGQKTYGPWWGWCRPIRPVELSSHMILSSAQTNSQLALMQQAVAGHYPNLSSGISVQQNYRAIEGAGSTTTSNLRIDVARLP